MLPVVRLRVGGAQPVPLSSIDGAFVRFNVGALVRFSEGALVRFNAGGALETSRLGAAVISRAGATPVKSRLGGAGVTLRPGRAELVRLCTPVMLFVKLCTPVMLFVKLCAPVMLAEVRLAILLACRCELASSLVLSRSGSGPMLTCDQGSGIPTIP